MTDSKKPDVVLDQVPGGEVMQERAARRLVHPAGLTKQTGRITAQKSRDCRD